MPECLMEDSNFDPVKKDFTISNYKIILCTLSHSSHYKLDFITHVVIDEAAQANEPSCLIPASRMSCLRPLIMAGDDQQLGPVVVSNEAKKFGLGLSLMERLRETCPLYGDSGRNKYIVMLKNNYRSAAKIIDLPNRLFYHGHLRAMAVVDPLSTRNILNRKKQCQAIVFHGVLSTEKKDVSSYYNTDELLVIMRYVIKLKFRHKVKEEDIGIIAAYKSQVEKIKECFNRNNWQIDVETVDAFQGQEKRVILITTVRGKGGHTDATLGFVTDVKRFNVALTRARAKAIVIGNPLSLYKSSVWNSYIKLCIKLGTCYGEIELHSESPSPVVNVLNALKNMTIDCCSL